MALVGIIEGELLLIKVSDLGSPPVLTHPCLINTERGIDFTTAMTETEVRDCTSPGLPAIIVRKAKSIDFAPSGAGKLDRTSVWPYIQWWKSGLARDAEITQNVTGAEGGWTGVGKLIIASMNIGGEAGDYQNFTISYAPASPFTWSQNA